MANSILQPRRQQFRAAPAWRSSPGGDQSVRFDAQRPAASQDSLESVAREKQLALAALRATPQQWLRPATDARLLACLILALEGRAIAVEDDRGMLFQYPESVQLTA